MEAAGLLTAQSSGTAEAESPSDRPTVTIISTRTGRRTSIHHDTDFADKMNAYIVSPLIPLPKLRLPQQLQPQQPQPAQQRKQQRAKQPKAAHRSVSCPEPATSSSSASSAASQSQSPQTQQSFFPPHQRQLSGQQRRKQTGRNPTLERLLQPSAREMSRSEQLLDKMRNLKLRIQRHAVQTNCGNVSVTDWPPPPDVLLAHAPPSVQRATPTSPTSAAASAGADGGGIVCSNSDIRSIIASIQQFEKSVQQNQLAQLIEVISLSSEPPLPPCLTSSPHRQPRQSAVRKQVCFIDPKQNCLVMPHHLTAASSAAGAAASSAAEAPPAGPSSPGQSPPPRRQIPSPPPPQYASPPTPSGTSSSSQRGSLCCSGPDDPGPSGGLSQTPLLPPPPLPPKDVSYDENGQTWDVYGADIDPDLLGQAIQTHLAARSNGSSETSASAAEAPPAAASSSNSQKRIQSPAVSLLCCAGGRN